MSNIWLGGIDMHSPILEEFDIPQLQKFILQYKELKKAQDSCNFLKALWYDYKIGRLKDSMRKYIANANIYELICGVVAIQLANPMQYKTEISLPRYTVTREPNSEYVLFKVDDITEQLTVSAGPAHHILLNKEIDAKVRYNVVLSPMLNNASEFNINRYNYENLREHFGHPSTDPKVNTDRLLRGCITHFMDWVITK